MGMEKIWVDDASIGFPVMVCGRPNLTIVDHAAFKPLHVLMS